MQKIKYINWLFPVLLLIKESFNLIKADTTGYTQPRSGSPRCDFLLMTILMKKLRALDSSHRSWNLLGWEAQLATPNQNM